MNLKSKQILTPISEEAGDLALLVQTMYGGICTILKNHLDCCAEADIIILY